MNLYQQPHHRPPPPPQPSACPPRSLSLQSPLNPRGVCDPLRIKFCAIAAGVVDLGSPDEDGDGDIHSNQPHRSLLPASAPPSAYRVRRRRSEYRTRGGFIIPHESSFRATTANAMTLDQPKGTAAATPTMTNNTPSSCRCRCARARFAGNGTLPPNPEFAATAVNAVELGSAGKDDEGDNYNRRPHHRHQHALLRPPIALPAVAASA